MRPVRGRRGHEDTLSLLASRPVLEAIVRAVGRAISGRDRAVLAAADILPTTQPLGTAATQPRLSTSRLCSFAQSLRFRESSAG